MKVIDPALLIVWGIEVELTAAIAVGKAKFDWIEVLQCFRAFLNGTVHHVNIVKAMARPWLILI